MTKKEELSKDILIIWEILTYAKDCYCYSSYIRNPETQQEKEYIAKSRDFRFMSHAFWRLTIIELSKLFGNNDKTHKFNIYKLINKLKPNGQYRGLKFNQSKVELWENNISLNKETIDIILKLRDEVYSHKDNYQNLYYANELNYQKVGKLIEIVSEIIKTIYSDYFNTDALIRTISYNEGRFNMIKILAEEKETRIKNKIDKLLGNVK